MNNNQWIRVSPSTSCPICGKPDWCLLARDQSAAICARIESSKRCGAAGYLHRLDDRLAAPIRLNVRAIEVASVMRDWASLVGQCQAAINGDDVASLARELGVDHRALLRLGVGRFGRLWAFPHEDGTGRISGVHLRTPDGRKPYVRGSRPGIATPLDLGECAPLLVTEGESDCAAALSLGFDAVARPGCGSSLTALLTFFRKRQPPAAVIIGDNDESGVRGAHDLATSLGLICRSVRIIFPPPYVKDLRAWVRAGANAADVRDAIAGASPISPQLHVRVMDRNRRNYT